MSATYVDGNVAKAVAASPSTSFDLVGGVYMLTAHINNASGLTAGLTILSGDGSSYIACSSTYAHVDGYSTLYLAPGQYKWSVTGTAGTSETFDLSVQRVPV